MECQHATALIADYLAGTLPVEQVEALRAHAAACARCRDELAAAEETWQQLGHIPPLAPDLPAMRTRFEALQVPPPHASRATARRAPRHLVLVALAAAALLVIGMGIGRQTVQPPVDTQMVALREELREMRQMMSLSLLQQQSATARLQGVISIRQMDNPGGDVIAALLDTLAYDPNPNVRLATIDALARFMDRDLVRRRTIETLPRQTSPLVQIALIDFVVESVGAESADALRALSKDATVADAVRMHAAQALRQLGARS
jgi:anti-sigma factor ChrR (cupin superfamily)